MKWEYRTPQRDGDTGPPPPGTLYRTKVPGGWLVYFFANSGLTFIPDPTWSWDWTKDEP